MLCDTCKRDRHCFFLRSAAGKNTSKCVNYEPNGELHNTEGDDKKTGDIISFEMEKLDREDRWTSDI